MTLQHFKVILLVGGVLIDDEQISTQLGDDEPKVELYPSTFEGVRKSCFIFINVINVYNIIAMGNI